MIEIESLSLNFESENTRLLGEIFSTPLPEEKIYHDKFFSSIVDTTFKPNMSKEINQRCGYKNTLNIKLNLGKVSYIERNLIDLDDLVDLENTSIDPDELLSEIKTSMMKVAKEDAKRIRLEKEKEVITMNSLIEKESFLRRMESLKDQNRKLEEKYFTLH